MCNEEIKARAIEYVKNGYSVVPFKKDKNPTLEAGQIQKLRVEPYAVEELTMKLSESNVVSIGLVTGSQSNIEIIDIDDKNYPGQDLNQLLIPLLREAIGAEVFDTLPIETSASNGRHIYYRHDNPGKSGKLAYAISDEGKKLPTIEIWSNEGQVICYPSKGYNMVQGNLLNIPFITTEQRNTLHEVCRRFDHRPAAETKKAAAYDRQYSAAFKEFDKRGDIPQMLTDAGFTLKESSGERIQIVRPDSPDGKASGNYHSAHKTVTIFSTNTELQPGKVYHASDLLIDLKYHGDADKAHQQLIAQGYGTHADEVPLKPIEDPHALFGHLFKQPTLHEYKEMMRSLPPEINSGYVIGGIPLMFPFGALSYICAYTSHGKSTAATNLALRLCPNHKVHYFGYEEDRKLIMLNLLTCYLGQTLTTDLGPNWKRVLKEYLRSGASALPYGSNAVEVSNGIQKFFEDIIGNNRISVSSDGYSAQTLTQAIRYLHDEKGVEIFFIDFLQLVDFGSNMKKRQRTDEVKEVCKALKDVAQETGVAIIATAQFGRSVVNHDTVQARYISECTDIEKLASVAIGIWNNNMKPNWKNDAIPVEYQKFSDPNTLFVNIMKYRESVSEVKGLLSWDGNKKVIGNIESPPIIAQVPAVQF